MNVNPRAPNLPYWSNKNRDLGAQNFEQNNSEHMFTRNSYACIYIYIYIDLNAYGTIDLLKTQFYSRNQSPYLSQDKRNLGMGWLRLVGSLKLWVSFAEYRLFKQASFTEETYNFREPTNRSHPICAHRPYS